VDSVASIEAKIGNWILFELPARIAGMCTISARRRLGVARSEAKTLLQTGLTQCSQSDSR